MAVKSIIATEIPQNIVGILWMVITGILFVFVTGIVRYIGSDLPAVEAAFIRYAIGLVLVSPIFIRIWRNRPEPMQIAGFAVRGVGSRHRRDHVVLRHGTHSHRGSHCHRLYFADIRDHRSRPVPG